MRDTHSFSLDITEKDEVLFLVASPFQVLCAYESINFFKVKKYTILVIYNPNDLRTGQLFNTLRYLGLKYKTYIAESTNRIFDILIKRKISDNFGNLKKFDFVFVGDYPSSVQRSFAIRFIKIHGQIVFMDDGNTSLLVLLNKKIFSAKARLFNTFFSILALLKRLKKNVFFSTYSDVNTKQKVIPNNLESLRNEECSKEGVFFIGTNSVPYCEVHQMKTDDYYNVLEKVLLMLRNSNQGQLCYYIFHGRDIGNQQIESICEKCGFKTLKLEEIVEMYFVKNKIEPLLVAGFTSSALYNLKKMFPLLKIIDVSVKTNLFVNKEYEMISLYYKSNGIDGICIELNNESSSIKAVSQAKND